MSGTHNARGNSPLVSKSKENVEEVEFHTFPSRELGESTDESIEGEGSALHKDSKKGEFNPPVEGYEGPIGMNEGGGIVNQVLHELLLP